MQKKQYVGGGLMMDPGGAHKNSLYTQLLRRVWTDWVCLNNKFEPRWRPLTLDEGLFLKRIKIKMQFSLLTPTRTWPEIVIYKLQGLTRA